MNDRWLQNRLWGRSGQTARFLPLFVMGTFGVFKLPAPLPSSLGNQHVNSNLNGGKLVLKRQKNSDISDIFRKCYQVETPVLLFFWKIWVHSRVLWWESRRTIVSDLDILQDWNGNYSKISLRSSEWLWTIIMIEDKPKMNCIRVDGFWVLSVCFGGKQYQFPFLACLVKNGWIGSGFGGVIFSWKAITSGWALIPEGSKCNSFKPSKLRTLLKAT